MANNCNSAFSAPVVYDVQPEFEELKRRFPAHVDPDYEGRRFHPIERCKDVSRENRRVAFDYVQMDRDASTYEVEEEIDRKGSLPALYEELLGFGKEHPNEQGLFPIVALGSTTRIGGRCYVACLSSELDGRRLYLCRINLDWQCGYRFLVRSK